MKFGGKIRGWYEKNGRDLPMRSTRDPYRTWVAEVILQQTRMDQGLPYLKNFLEAFPDVRTLARAREDEVLRLWQGLGYYSRARHMHASARQVAEEMNGVMPADYQGLLALKGVGKYTAAAIASWCYKEPLAAVDGNVSRLIARLYGIGEAINTPAGERQIYALATELLEGSDPGEHNQAMIDFGALLCTPVSPRCQECPLSDRCHARLSGTVEQFPVKIRGKKPVNRWFYFYIMTSRGETILEKRGDSGIWRSLYQFPLAEYQAPQSDSEMVQEIEALYRGGESGIQELSPTINQLSPTIRQLSPTIRHQLSHRTIHARFIHVELPSFGAGLPAGWIVVPVGQLDQYPVPRLIQRYLESVKI
ncbi:MAG: A/G-specific adenine glycosylase [Bacteroidales bacterium]|nr:A/G-specific adenine glycosylase [Bacteroidales bacterium]